MDKMHEIVKEQVENREETIEWKHTMMKSFSRMDKDVIKWRNYAPGSTCRCELQTPQCDAVGSTAVVPVVTPDEIVVSNYEDSRAVLCDQNQCIFKRWNNAIVITMPKVNGQKVPVYVVWLSTFIAFRMALRYVIKTNSCYL